MSVKSSIPRQSFGAIGTASKQGVGMGMIKSSMSREGMVPHRSETGYQMETKISHTKKKTIIRGGIPNVPVTVDFT